MKHLVERRLHAGNEVAGRESNLFGLSEIVLRVPIEHQFTDGNEGVVSMRPHLRHVEDVPSVLEPFTDRHHLHVECPRSGTTFTES